MVGINHYHKAGNSQGTNFQGFHGFDLGILENRNLGNVGF